MDNKRLAHFLNIKSLGTSQLKEAQAFKKTRTSSKVFTQSLSLQSSSLTTKYFDLLRLLNPSTTLTDFASYGRLKQHHLTAGYATLGNFTTLLDRSSLNLFTSQNFAKLEAQTCTPTSLANIPNHLESGGGDIQIGFFENNNRGLSMNLDNPFTDRSLTPSLLFNPQVLHSLNDRSDSKQIKNPLLKVLNSRMTSFNNQTPTTYSSLIGARGSVIDLVFNPQSDNNRLLSTERTVRQAADTPLYRTQQNFTPNQNSLISPTLHSLATKTFTP